MNRLFSFTLFSLAMLAWPAWSAPPNEKPSMSPELGASSGEKKDPFGVKGLTKDRPKDAKTEITSKKQATFDNATSVAEFEGSVVVKDPQFTLFCDQLRVTLGKDRKGLQLVEAFGNVIIVQENTDDAGKKVKATGRSGKAVYDPASGDVTLTVWPSVQHDINMQVATEEGTIMTLNRGGRMTTKGGSRTVIVDNSQQ
ncbi:MAG TPA: LptA/OstA family protein [Terrimicrobiaceae bacterium]|nr:LptA/OstA family protein [Terrimicrobiaceae bacterium]